MFRRLAPLTALFAFVAMAIAPSCPRPNGYTVTTIFPQTDFPQMTGMHWIPGDDTHAVVLEKSGIIWRINTAEPNIPPAVFLDIRDRILPNATLEEGLLGLAFPPDFAASGRVYVHYSARGDAPINPGGVARKGVIARFQANAVAADPNSERRLIELPDPYSNHNGGGLQFGPDGYLYASFGDGGSAGDPLGHGQRLDVLFGKILRIDVSGDGYAIPPDNPFVGVSGARPEIWAYGLRNTWRFSFDTQTGVLWAGDVGQGVLEEVDIIVRGGELRLEPPGGDPVLQPTVGLQRRRDHRSRC